jgi:hypothetical protein
MGLETVVFNADSSDEIDTAFQMIDRERLDAVVCDIRTFAYHIA